MRLKLTNKLAKTLAAVSDCGGERAIERAVKKELPVLRIKARLVGRQHVDGEIRREARNVFAIAQRKGVAAVACRSAGTRTGALVAASVDHHCDAGILLLPEFSCLARALAFCRSSVSQLSRPAALRAAAARIVPDGSKMRGKQDAIGRLDACRAGHENSGMKTYVCQPGAKAPIVQQARQRPHDQQQPQPPQPPQPRQPHPQPPHRPQPPPHRQPPQPRQASFSPSCGFAFSLSKT